MSGPPRLRYRRCPCGTRPAGAGVPGQMCQAGLHQAFRAHAIPLAVRAATGAVPTGTWGASSRRILTLAHRSHSLRKSRSLRGRVMMHAAVIFDFRPARGFRV